MLMIALTTLNSKGKKNVKLPKKRALTKENVAPLTCCCPLTTQESLTQH